MNHPQGLCRTWPYILPTHPRAGDTAVRWPGRAAWRWTWLQTAWHEMLQHQNKEHISFWDTSDIWWYSSGFVKHLLAADEKMTAMKFYEGVPGGKMNKWLNFGGDLGLLRWVNEQNTIIVVSYPDQGAGNDPQALGWGNIGVTICLGQRGLCSHSAWSSSVYHSKINCAESKFLMWPKRLNTISAGAW